MLFILTILFSYFCGGCEFYGTYRELTLTLPELPQHWKGIFVPEEYRIYTPDYKEPGELRSYSVCGEEYSVTIRVPKTGYIPCLLEPLAGGCRFKPAGIVLDEYGAIGSESRTPSFRWEDGFTASLLMRLYDSEAIYSGINIERLSAEIISAAEGNVWDLDSESMLIGLTFGSFTANSIKTLPLNPIDLPLPSGTWYWDNPFREPLEILAEEETVILELPRGRHHLYHVESHEQVSLEIGETEWYAVYHLRELCISGHW